ncbi:MAG: hypothetical protein HYX39_03305 [Bacteroidetes bacterium]|nr:hypothetical protein [Bacteroidota bacterium]
MKTKVIYLMILATIATFNCASQTDSLKAKTNHYLKMNLLVSTCYSQVNNFNINNTLNTIGVSTLPTTMYGSSVGAEFIKAGFTADIKIGAHRNTQSKWAKLQAVAYTVNIGYRFKVGNNLFIQPFAGYAFSQFTSKLNIYNENKNISLSNLQNATPGLMEIYLETSSISTGLKILGPGLNAFFNYYYQLGFSNWKSDYNTLSGFPTEKANYFQIGIELPIKTRSNKCARASE